ncbi:hypothetical protein [Fodinicurvata sp. EGI_FJ10296]|uniref:hypothetical protein n=1 Tax=Fodinicurvata sp. EGI_FJ10296 TaxID=3231908 RepID=UPI0034515181
MAVTTTTPMMEQAPIDALELVEMNAHSAGIMTAQPATRNDGSPPTILLIGDNTHFVDYVTAVGAAAGTEVVGLAACPRLPENLGRILPLAAIVDMLRPDHDAAFVLPQLAAARSIGHLAILADHPSTSAVATAERLARSIAPWSVEVWAKPVHAAFLKWRLAAMAGKTSETAGSGFDQSR